MSEYLFPYALYLMLIALAGTVGVVTVVTNEPVAEIPQPPALSEEESALVLLPEELLSPNTQSGKAAMTTMFWVGEVASSENDYISNTASYWDEYWESHFGGVDDPENRCGFYPCGFTPKENPFYVALPYGEFDNNGNVKSEAAAVLPLKNRWVKIIYQEAVCYGQWEDVGPNNENDFAYVFGSAQNPTNTFGAEAGLDISPALWKCLNLPGNDVVYWEFIPDSAVPEGPWKTIVTN